MASVYKPKGRTIYRIEFKDQYGVTRTVSSGMEVKRNAEQLAAKIEHDADRVRSGMQLESGDLTGAFLGLYRAGREWKEFREEYRLRVLAGKAASSQTVAEECLDRFERLMKPKVVNAIMPQTVADFVVVLRQQRGRRKGELASPATINKNLRYLKAALHMAQEWGYVHQVPKIRMEREPKRLPRYVTPEHFTSIYDACQHAAKPEGLPCSPADWWRGLVVLLYMTGWRIGQAMSLGRTALDLISGTATAFSTAEETKGKRDALVPLHSLVVEHLRLIVDAGSLAVFPWPYHRRTLDGEWVAIQEKATIQADGEKVPLHLPCWRKHEHTRNCHVYGFHDLRRAFATMNADLPEPVLQHLMQHKHFATTKGYINVGRQLRPSVPKLYVPTINRVDDERAAVG